MMERPERYDPEDLEHLMLERSFDELLAEERAYALRHLEDGAEYERMRALLYHVREDQRDHARMDADPAVRERVLAAFRAQQQPQWRIWLNSVGGFLLPSRPALYWRPALALGTVAVLIFASLMTWNAMEPKAHKVLAEVKQGTPAPTAPTGPTVQEDRTPPTPAAEPNAQTGAPRTSTSALGTDKRVASAEAPAPVADMLKDDGNELAEKAKPESTFSGAERAAAGYAQSTEEESATVIPTQRKTDRQSSNTVVSQDSMAPMAVVATAKVSQGEVSADRTGAAPGYSEDDLLGLLRAAW